MAEELRAYTRHLRAMRAQNNGKGLCIPGARIIAAANGLNFDEFLRNGLTVSSLKATNNPFCIELAERAEAEAAS